MDIKKILMSGGMLVFVAAVVAGGTGAFFTDTETSTGNVFTAGSVSINLVQPGYTHTWLGDPASDPGVQNDYFFNHVNSDSDDGPYFVMGDLKPGDNGQISATLQNGANDAFVCARMVETTDGSALLADNLFFRTGTGPGGSLGDITTAIPLNTWFAPAPPSSPIAAVSVNANQTVPLAIEYCLGELVQGTDFGTQDNGSCIVPGTPNGSATDWNELQGESFEVSIEYYAVQQRNNEDFDCSSLNVEVTTNTGWSPNASAQEWFAKSRNNNPNFEVAVGTDDTVSADQDEAEATWVAGDANQFTLSYDSTSNEATYEAGGETVTFEVGTGPFTTLGITAKAPADQTTTVDGLALNILPGLTPTSVVANGGNAYIQIDGLDFSQDWTLTGEFTFSAVGTGPGFNQENPAVQFSIN